MELLEKTVDFLGNDYFDTLTRIGFFIALGLFVLLLIKEVFSLLLA